jgi:hypothetical protein
METLLKLTEVWYYPKEEKVYEKPILVGVGNIISIIGKPGASWNYEIGDFTEVKVRSGLVDVHNVKESVEEIYQMYKS